MLTTHDMDDIEAVCKRLILIDKGQKLFDGTLTHFKSVNNNGYGIKLEFDGDCPIWMDDPMYSLNEIESHTWLVTADSHVIAKDAMITLIERYNPINIYIQEPRIEDIVRNMFSDH